VTLELDPAVQTLMPGAGVDRRHQEPVRKWRPEDPPRPSAPTTKVVALLFPRLFPGQWPVLAPLPVMALASNLRFHGYRVEVFDQRLDEGAVERIAALGEELLFVGLSCHVGDQLKNALEIARRLKAELARLPSPPPIVMGGWFASMFPDLTLEEPSIDVACAGQSEGIVVELAEALARGGDLSAVRGISYRDGGRVVSTGKRPLEDVNVFPPIDYGWIDPPRYLDRYDRLNFFTSRGCPGRCKFCAIFCVYHQGWTGLDPWRVAYEVRRIKERWPQVQGLEIVDTDFASDKARTLGIARALIDADLGVGWKCSARIYNLKDYSLEELRTLRRSGCEEIEIGVESGSQRILDVQRKDTKVADIEPTVVRVAQAGIRARVNVILGIQSEEVADFRATFRLLSRLRKLDPRPLWSFYRYVPIPRTSLGTQTYGLKRRGHNGESPKTLKEILDVKLPEEDQPMFWLGEEHELRVRRAYFFYIRLAFYMDGRWGRSPKGLLYRFLLAPLARLRLRRGWLGWPFERALNRRLGPELPPYM
jgi:radical SAM superfamily enzyme YgiQ (UPF0313 family)